MISIICPSRYRINRILIKEKTKVFLEKIGYSEKDNLNLIFIGKNKMRQISLKYKKEDVALPVLSFSYKETYDKEKLLGEILFCYPQIVLLAAERNKKVDVIMLQLLEHGLNSLTR